MFSLRFSIFRRCAIRFYCDCTILIYSLCIFTESYGFPFWPLRQLLEMISGEDVIQLLDRNLLFPPYRLYVSRTRTLGNRRGECIQCLLKIVGWCKNAVLRIGKFGFWVINSLSEFLSSSVTSPHSSLTLVFNISIKVSWSLHQYKDSPLCGAPTVGLDWIYDEVLIRDQLIDMFDRYRWYWVGNIIDT